MKIDEALARRLRVDGERTLRVFAAPEGLEVALPAKARVAHEGTGDVVLLFARDRAALARGFASARDALRDESSALWVAYPKKTAALKSDLSRDEGWAIVVEAGYGPVSQVALDETWSALRFKRESTVARKPGSAVRPRSSDGAATNPARPTRVEPAITNELRAALDENARARAVFETLAPSHRREYLAWIAEAKKPETRARRAAQAASMLAAGVRDRNETYRR